MRDVLPIENLVILNVDAEEIAAAIWTARPGLAIHKDGWAPALADLPRVAALTFRPPPEINDVKDLRWVHSSGAGVDALLKTLKRDVPLITRTVGDMGGQMAEFVLCYLLAETQRYDLRLERQRARRWSPTEGRPEHVMGRSALVFGTGAIGRTVAERLSQFGVAVDGVSRSGTPVAPFRTVHAFDALPDEAAKTADIVVLALPGGAATREIADARLFARFEDAHLFNIGRGETVNEADLLAALDKGKLRAATLDVTAKEPPPEASPLWTHPKIRISPHVSGPTRPQDAAQSFLDALDALEAGREPELVVDPKRGY